MLINETDDECRIAIVVDNLLQEMLIEHTASTQIKNNIYKGVVVQVQNSLQAAFVDYGEKKHGFLPSSEINPLLHAKKGLSKHDSIQQKLKVGQEVIVQVTREAVDHKGSALTTNITLPGRYMVLMPENEKGGISKKIDSQDERDRLKGFLSGIESEDHAVIIRTAGVGRKLGELKKDYTTLKKKWSDIKNSFKKMRGAGLIVKEDNAVVRTLRDYYTEEIDEVWVDNPETIQDALMFFKMFAPRRQKDLKLFVGDRSLFGTHNIEKQVEQLTSNSVNLKSGGSIVINQTEALVAIDVNSGKSNQEGNIDSTALRTNLEASQEIARQLRLRNLGGLIVIDFIDMENESFRKQVEEKMNEVMQMDKAQVRMSPISQFGLMEMSRQRLAVGISSTIESPCPVCNGKGKIPSTLASVNLIIRSIRDLAAKGNVKSVIGELPLELVNHLLIERRQSIYDLEMEFCIDIILRGDPNLLVFQDNQLKSIYERGRHHQQSQQQQNKKEGGKQEPVKKKSKKQPHQKDQPAKKHQKDKPKEEVASPEEIDSNPELQEPEEQVEIIAQKEVKAPKKGKKEKEKLDEKTEREMSSYGIHPAALFSDVQDLDEEELEEITESFENRLKGKAEDNGRQLIDDKYLWKTQNGESEQETPEKTAENLVDSDSEAVEGGTGRDTKKNHAKKRKAPSRKSTAKKPAKKAKKEEKKEEVEAPEKKSDKSKENTEKEVKKTKASKTSKAKSSAKQKEKKEEKESKKPAKPKSNAAPKKSAAKKEAAELENSKEEKPVKKAKSSTRKPVAKKSSSSSKKKADASKDADIKKKTTKKAPAKKKTSTKKKSED